LPAAILRALSTLSLKLLHPPSQLVLQPEVLGALNRHEKFRQLALLTFRKIEPLTLQPYRLVEKLPDAVLIGIVAGHQLSSQLPPQLPLASHQSHPLLLELPVGRLKPRRLSVRELKAAAHEIGGPLPESILQFLPSRGRRLCLIRPPGLCRE